MKEEDQERVISVRITAKGGDHFKNKGTVTRLEQADKSFKTSCPQIKYRLPSNFFNPHSRTLFHCF